MSWCYSFLVLSMPDTVMEMCPEMPRLEGLLKDVSDVSESGARYSDMPQVRRADEWIQHFLGVLFLSNMVTACMLKVAFWVGCNVKGLTSRISQPVLHQFWSYFLKYVSCELQNLMQNTHIILRCSHQHGILP